MRCTSAVRHRAQRGVSLIEALVASAVLGIVGVVGLTAWDTAAMAASQAVRHSWAQCMVRSELNAVLAAPWASGYPSPDPALVNVTVTPVGSRPGSGPGQEQRILVRAFDPQSGIMLSQAAAFKVSALQGRKDMDGKVLSDINSGCPPP